MTLKRFKRLLLPDLSLSGGGLRTSFLLGGLAYAAQYIFCILYTPSFSIMGVQTRRIQDFVLSQFKWVILISQVKILCAYIIIGGILGLAAGFCLRAWLSYRKRPASPGGAAAGILLFVYCASAVFLVNDILVHPALYNEHLYARGPLRAALHAGITDSVHPAVLMVLKTAVFAWFLPMALVFTRGMFVMILRVYRRFPGGIMVAFAAALIITVAVNAIPGVRNEGPNVIIIAADSFRYDRVSALGGRPGLTPGIDRLVKEGVSLDDFHVQLPRTFPSWYSLLSGLYPAQHGIRTMFPREEDLRNAKLILPEALRKRGYTVSAVADYAGDIFSRMGCFDRVKAPQFNFAAMVRQRGLEVHFLLLPFLQNRLGRALFPEMTLFAQNSDPDFLADAVKREIEYLSGEKRFFLTVFFSATHFPYASPYPHYNKYATKGYRGEYKYLKINDPTKNSVVSPEDVKQIRGLFDGACAAVDESIGGILALLRTNGLFDNSIIVFTADHGENLYDDGMDLGHGEHFRGEYSTHVPMIIKFHRGYAPRSAVARYGGVVEQVDFTPTLLDVLGVRTGAVFGGVSFRPVLEGRVKRIPRIAYAETGIWFVDRGEQFFQQQRIRYPDVSVLCRTESPGHEVVLKEEFRDIINIAKHRAVFDEKYKVIYIPTREGVRFEMYRRGDKNYVNLYEPGNPEFARLHEHLKSLVTRYEKALLINGMFIPDPER